MEQVLVTPAEQLATLGPFQGLLPLSEAHFQQWLQPQHLYFKPREEMEQNPEYKQLIPYVVLSYQQQLFHYQRGAAGNEKRLTAKRSIGLGGHINVQDGDLDAGLFHRGMLRELYEEVECAPIIQQRFLGLLNDDRTFVGSVHLGIVYLMELAAPNVFAKEASIQALGFETVSNLLTYSNEFESWSTLILESLSSAI